MPKYTYTAIGKEGKRESATIEAASVIAAGHLLKAEGLMPLALDEVKENGFADFLANFQNVPLKQKIVFIEDLQVMMKSGIAAPRALKIISKQTKHKKFKKVLDDLAAGVESGKSLHEVMERYPKIFSRIFISMVKVGELSGNLEKALDYLGV
ncbi:MAG: type II secretion system F family protein, partial [Candidatus Doudnabacteria bacterium]|nr:type II secretion system F family protein [Candidatus Doudnabacteria bacterium]